MTSMTESLPGPLLKTDLLGRIKTPAARREQILNEFEQSGTSGVKFAELLGVKYQTFATWGAAAQTQECYVHQRKNLEGYYREGPLAGGGGGRCVIPR